MMKRITIYPILLFAALAASVSSCDDFIDKFPENKVDVKQVDYTKISDMYMPVSGLYAQARNNFSFWGGYGLMSVRGDDADKGSSPTDQIEFTYCKQFQYAKIKGYWALNATWEGLYKVVSVANSAIESLNEYKKNITTDADLQKYNQYMGEVRFIRAYAYFRIVNLWGDAPLITDNKQAGVTKVKAATLFKFIDDELQFCSDVLPAIRPNEQVGRLGAVTKYSALALKAKVNLYTSNWDGVLAATSKIIGDGKFGLYGDYYQLFKIPGKLCDESLYELQYTDFGLGSGDVVTSDNWFAFQGPRGGSNPVQGWGFITPTQSLITFMTARNEGVRASTTFMFTNATTPSGDFIPKGNPGEPTCYNGKAYTPANQMTSGRSDYGMNNNIRILRYADVLLMDAEAKIRKGQNGDASINLVRQRAGLAPLTNATIDQVIDERRAELAMEWGDRFFDLVRTDKAKDVLVGFVKGQSEYYPIPQNQIDLNPNLDQPAK